jgi:hypothetical protein
MDWKTGAHYLSGARHFLFSTASRPALGAIQLSIQWISGVLYPEVKFLGSEADHSYLVLK